MPKTSKSATKRNTLLAVLSEPGAGDQLVVALCASLKQHAKLPEGICLLVARMVKDAMLKRLRQNWTPPSGN